VARYEKGYGLHRKLWEIEVTEAAFTIRYGSVHGELESYSREHATPADAQRAADQLAVQRVADGYRLIEPPRPRTPRQVHPLEAELRGRPDDGGLLLVYADLLQSQGDPRGQLIVLEQQGLADEAGAWIDLHKARLLGGLIPLALPTVTCTWQGGFLRELRLEVDSAHPEITAMHMLDALVELPDAAFVTSLVFGEPIVRQADFHDVIETLVMHAADLPRLVRLTLGDQGEDGAPWMAIGDVGALLAALPQLEQLRVNGDVITVSQVSAPALRELELRTTFLGGNNLRALAAASWPELVTLRLWIGSGSGGASALADLVHGGRAPKLRRLAIHDCHFSDELRELLSRTQLDELVIESSCRYEVDEE
jgi:uncharacterized protein (TIGR02996 family)